MNGVSKIKAATVNKLIERISYDGDIDTNLVKQFLLTYRSFLKPSELLEKLILRYIFPPFFVTAI